MDEQLTLPSFLRREQSPDQAQRLKRITAQYRKRRIKSPPLRKPKLDGERVTLHLGDELPNIGCGIRTCILKRGRKWLRIEECATGRRAKVPVDFSLGEVR